MTRITLTALAGLTLAASIGLAACDPPPPNYPTQLLPSGCILITNQPEQTPPPGWQYWIEDDGDPRGYWANTLPAYTAPRLGYSEGPTADIYDSTTCSFSGGTVVGSRP